MDLIWHIIEQVLLIGLIAAVLVLVLAAWALIAADILIAASGVVVAFLLWGVGLQPPWWLWLLLVAAGPAAWWFGAAYIHKNLNGWIQRHAPWGWARYLWEGTGIEGQDIAKLGWFVGWVQRIKYAVAVVGPILLLLMVMALDLPSVSVPKAAATSAPTAGYVFDPADYARPVRTPSQPQRPPRANPPPAPAPDRNLPRVEKRRGDKLYIFGGWVRADGSACYGNGCAYAAVLRG